MKRGAAGALTPDGIPERGSITTSRPKRVVRLKVVTEPPKRRLKQPRTLEVLLARPSAPRKLRAGARTRSLGVTRLSPRERKELAEIEAELASEGIRLGPPATFAECAPGPCGHYSCRHHLGLEVIVVSLYRLRSDHVRRTPATIKVAHPDREIGDLPTCSLRVAAAAAVRADPLPEAHGRRRGEPGTQPVMSLDEIGAILGITPERVRQIEAEGLRKLRVEVPAALGAEWL